MKKFLMTIFGIFAFVSTWADTVPVVIIETTTAKVNIPMSTIKSITYKSDTEMEVNYNTGDDASTYLLENIKSVKFGNSESSTGIAQVEITSDSAEVKMYDLSGKQLSTKQLKKGVYIIKENGKAKKVIGGK